jgi:hypothetical protein
MTSFFGWCLDKLCHKCPTTTPSGLTCGCGCHTGSQQEENNGNV